MKRKLKEEKQKKRKQMKKGNNRVDAEEESDNIQIIPKKKKLPVKKENKMKENTKMTIAIFGHRKNGAHFPCKCQISFSSILTIEARILKSFLCFFKKTKTPQQKV